MASSAFSRRTSSPAAPMNGSNNAKPIADEIRFKYLSYLMARRTVDAILLSTAAMLVLGCTRDRTSRPPQASYAPAGSCRTCHAAITESYEHVAMARSLYRPASGNVIEDYRTHNHFYHAASGRYYRM